MRGQRIDSNEFRLEVVIKTNPTKPIVGPNPREITETVDELGKKMAAELYRALQVQENNAEFSLLRQRGCSFSVNLLEDLGK